MKGNSMKSYSNIVENPSLLDPVSARQADDGKLTIAKLLAQRGVTMEEALEESRRHLAATKKQTAHTHTPGTPGRPAEEPQHLQSRRGGPRAQVSGYSTSGV